MKGHVHDIKIFSPFLYVLFAVIPISQDVLYILLLHFWPKS